MVVQPEMFEVGQLVVQGGQTVVQGGHTVVQGGHTVVQGGQPFVHSRVSSTDHIENNWVARTRPYFFWKSNILIFVCLFHKLLQEYFKVREGLKKSDIYHFSRGGRSAGVNYHFFFLCLEMIFKQF